MENVLKSYKNLKKNDYFKKNSFNKSSQNSMIENLSKQIPKTKQISILTIKDFNKKSQKPINLNKKVLNYLNQNIKKEYIIIILFKLMLLYQQIYLNQEKK